MPKLQCLVIGDINIDFTVHSAAYPPEGKRTQAEKADFRLGGSGCITAVMLSHLGVPTALAANLGADVLGQFALRHLSDSDLDISLIRDLPGEQTGFFTILLTPDGTSTTLGNRGANAFAVDKAAILKRLGEFTHLHISGYSLIGEEQYNVGSEMISTFKQAGKTISLDPGVCTSQEKADRIKGLLKMVDYFLPSREELEYLVFGDSIKERIEKILDLNCKAVILKMGEEGGIFSEGHEFIHLPAKTITGKNYVDTTGAGDSFNAGFLSAILHEKSPGNALKNANHTATKIITSKNGIIDLIYN